MNLARAIANLLRPPRRPLVVWTHQPSIALEKRLRWFDECAMRGPQFLRSVADIVHAAQPVTAQSLRGRLEQLQVQAELEARTRPVAGQRLTPGLYEIRRFGKTRLVTRVLRFREGP